MLFRNCPEEFGKFLLVVLLLAVVVVPASAAELKLSTSSLSFLAVAGKDPAPQLFSAYASPAVAGFSPSVLATTQTGNWIAVSTVSGGSYPSAISVVVAVKSASLPVGDYTGQVSVTQVGLDKSPGTVAVSLKVIPSVPYISVNPAAIDVQAKVGVDPAPVVLVAFNAGTGTLSPSFSAITDSGGNWLSLSQPTGGSFSSSSGVSVNIQSAGLALGTYTGKVTVSALTALNSPVNVPVKLVVGSSGGALISVSPASLSFVAGLGANPSWQAFAVNNAGTGSLRPSITWSTVDGGSWLLARSNGGSFGSSFTVVVNVNIDGLLKGTYRGTVTISDPSAANSPVNVPVSLLVEDPKPVMQLTTTGITFFLPGAGDFMLETYMAVFNNGTGVLKWTATSNQPWLSASPTADEAESSSAVYIWADARGLSVGIYRGQITFSSNAVSGDATQVLPVVMGIGVPMPTLNEGGVVNGASFASTTVAPGSIVSIFGRNLGPAQGLQAALVGGKLPTRLGEVRVLFNDIPAPLFYVSGTQLNVQVPVELAGSYSAEVQVIAGDLPSVPLMLNLRAADPGVFLVGGLPGIFFANSTTQVTAQNQARGGDYLTLWATGLGAVEGLVQTGAPATAALRTMIVPKVTLGGVPAPLLYAGLAPGFVGLYQINIQVPDNVPSGNTSLVISMGGTDTAPMVVPIR
jgi:uncharacterized protein (TIGR03437 family)